MIAKTKQTAVRTFRSPRIVMATLALLALTAGAALVGCEKGKMSSEVIASSGPVADGQRIFRFETFGDEQLWTDTLRLHEVVEKTVDPTTALTVGLKRNEPPTSPRHRILRIDQPPSSAQSVTGLC